MVYCANSRALAAMEFFVHLDPSVAPDDLVMVEVGVRDDVAMEEVELAALPLRWRATEEVTARIGMAWIRAARTALLRVPSAVVPGDWNVLVNPAHTEFAKLRVISEQPFYYDERMFR